MEYGLGYTIIRSPYNPYSIYLRGTIGFRFGLLRMIAGSEYWDNLGQYNIGYLGKMEKKMETTSMGYIGAISGSTGLRVLRSGFHCSPAQNNRNGGRCKVAFNHGAILLPLPSTGPCLHGFIASCHQHRYHLPIC